jgi:hypothetical protein
MPDDATSWADLKATLEDVNIALAEGRAALQEVTAASPGTQSKIADALARLAAAQVAVNAVIDIPPGTGQNIAGRVPT